MVVPISFGRRGDKNPAGSETAGAAGKAANLMGVSPILAIVRSAR
jgi:hypothetical protein